MSLEDVQHMSHHAVRSLELAARDLARVHVDHLEGGELDEARVHVLLILESARQISDRIAARVEGGHAAGYTPWRPSVVEQVSDRLRDRYGWQQAAKHAERVVPPVDVALTETVLVDVWAQVDALMEKAA